MATKRPTQAQREQALIDAAVARALEEARRGLVTADSKPHLVGELRKTWRGSAEHAAEQVKRFLRLAVLAAAPSVIDLLNGGKFDRKTLIAFIVPVAEAAYRQMFPALGAKSVDDAQGVTIVPSQVGAETLEIPVEGEVEVAAPDPPA